MTHPNKMGPPDENWMVLTDDGPEFYETEDEAREEAQSAMEDYVMAGETQAAKHVVVARVSAYVVRKNENDESAEDESEDEDFESVEADIYDYELIDVSMDDDTTNRSH